MNLLYKDMSTYRNSDLIMAAGSGYGGGCFCPKDSGDGGGGAGGLLDGNLGLLAAGAAAFFLLYTTATMLARRKRSTDEDYSSHLDIVYKGKKPQSIDSMTSVNKNYVNKPNEL